MNLLTQNQKNFLLSIFITAFYFIFLLYAASFHELWRDEAEVWLFARDTSLTNLLSYARNTGHPILWHIILIPFAKFGFPKITITIIHCFIATGVVFLILHYSKIPWLLKFFFCFGYFLVFEYGILARNYSIGIFLTFLALAFYSKRFANSIFFTWILFLLYSTNAYSAIVASGLSLVYLIEIFQLKNKKRIHLVAVSVIILGGLFFLYQVYPEPDSQKASFFSWTRVPESLLISFFPENPHLPLSVSYWKLLFSLFVIFLSGRLFTKFWQTSIFFIYTISALLIFFAFVYMNGPRHAGFLVITVVSAYWLFLYYEQSSEQTERKVLVLEKIFQGLIFFSFIFSFYLGILQTKKDIDYNYSNAKEMAGFMKNSGYDSEEVFLIAHSPDLCKTVLYYLDYTKSMYYPAEDRVGSFMFWTKDFQRARFISQEEILDKILKTNKPKGKIAIAVLDFPIESKTPDPIVHFSLPGLNLFEHPGFIPIKGYENFQFLYKTSGTNEFMKDEQFYLYRVLLNE